MPIQREYLSPNEIAELLGVSPFTIRRYIKVGELRAVKLLGGFRVHREDLQRFLKAHEVNPAEEELSPEEAVPDKPGNEKEHSPASPTALPPAAPGPAPAAVHPIVIPPRSSKKKAQRTRSQKSRRTEKT